MSEHLKPYRLRPHQRAALASLGAEHGLRVGRGDTDVCDFLSEGCDCDYCTAFMVSRDVLPFRLCQRYCNAMRAARDPGPLCPYCDRLEGLIQMVGRVLDK